jgi:hypothetical protein
LTGATDPGRGFFHQAGPKEFHHMTMATEAQKMQLAEAFLRMARDVLRPVPSDPEAARDFGVALFECPDGHADVAGLVAALCRPDEVQDVLRVLADFEAAD